MNSIEIAVDVKLEQNTRMVGRPARCRRLHALESKAGKVKLIDEYIDHPDLVVFVDIVVQ